MKYAREKAVGTWPALSKKRSNFDPSPLRPQCSRQLQRKQATSTIPIVCPALADAVHLGLIVSEARSGGNLTGIEPYFGGLPAKQIDLAHDVVPTALKIGLLTNDADPKGPPSASRA